MSNKNFRRRWSFEKGRDSGVAIFAAALTGASVAAVLGVFHYDYHSPDDKRQSTVMSVIDLAEDSDFSEMLDRRDPARTYGINGGGFGELLGERRFDVTIPEDLRPGIPEFPSAAPKGRIAPGKFPAAMGLSVPLPAGTAAGKGVPDPRPKVIAPDGSVLLLPFLQGEKSLISSGGESVIRISGDGILLNSEVVHSCGNAAMDARGETALKTSGAAPGTYIVSWPGTREKRS